MSARLGLSVLLAILVPISVRAAVLPDDVVIESNKARAKEGLQLLVPSEALMAAAQARAEDMARSGFFAHKGADGSSPWRWVKDQGYSFSRAAENLAVNYEDADGVVAGWLASPGHRANLLDGRLEEIGIGVADGMHKGERATYVVQYLATRVEGTLSQAAAAVQTSVQVIIEPGTEPVSLSTQSARPDIAVLMAQLQSLLAILRGLVGA